MRPVSIALTLRASAAVASGVSRVGAGGAHAAPVTRAIRQLLAHVGLRPQSR